MVNCYKHKECTLNTLDHMVDEALLSDAPSYGMAA